MRFIHSVCLALVISLEACAAAPVSPGSGSAASVTDSLAVPCGVPMPQKQPWNGGPLPVPQTDRAAVLVYEDPADSLQLWAVMTDGDAVVASLTLSKKQLGQLADQVQLDAMTAGKAMITGEAMAAAQAVTTRGAVFKYVPPPLATKPSVPPRPTIDETSEFFLTIASQMFGELDFHDQCPASLRG